MTLDEAKTIMDASRESGPMIGVHGAGMICVDGIYSLTELEAILVIARAEIEKQEAKVTAE